MATLDSVVLVREDKTFGLPSKESFPETINAQQPPIKINRLVTSNAATFLLEEFFLECYLVSKQN